MKSKTISDLLETHFEIVSHINNTVDIKGSLANRTQLNKGRGGLYELAEDLSIEFNAIHQDTEWGIDRDWVDTLCDFLIRKDRYETTI